MILTIPKPIAEIFLKRMGFKEDDEKKQHRVLRLRDFGWGHRSEPKTYDIRGFSIKERMLMRSIAIDVAESSGQSKDAKWAKNLARDIKLAEKLEEEDAAEAEVRDLKALPAIVDRYCREKLPRRWAVMVDKGFNARRLVAYMSASYHPATKTRDGYTAAYVSISFLAWERGTKSSDGFVVHGGDLPATVPAILAKHGIFTPDKEEIAGYDALTARYNEFRKAIGEQFESSGLARLTRSHWGENIVKLTTGGEPAKLICDDDEEFGESQPFVLEKPGDGFVPPDEEDGEGDESLDDNQIRFDLPISPLIRVFDLTRHQFCVVHTIDMKPYVYTPDVVDKLVLPQDHKDFIHVLLKKATGGSAEADFVRGKSGGTTILCHGSPGTGKTLTAEVFSECIERPLYSVQCAQLGLSASEVEKSLDEILERAAKWRAVLFIDEADVYIMARGSSMVQNAVVGVFLRVLEYFNGILFMATNRGESVDDAIRSRCIAEIQYGTPESVADKKRLWEVIGTHYKIATISKITGDLVKAFPNASGRDVKQLCRLVRAQTGTKPTLSDFKTIAKFKPGGTGEEA